MQKGGFGFRVIEGRTSSHDSYRSAEPSLVQAGLFPFSSGRTIIFVSMPSISEKDFVALVQVAQPAFAIELRRAPRFDIGRLSREIVFKWFEQANCKYLDPMPRRGGDVDDIRSWIQATADVFRAEKARPIMFFVSTAQDGGLLRRSICDALGCAEGKWQIFEIPEPDSARPRFAAAK